MEQHSAQEGRDGPDRITVQVDSQQTSWSAEIDLDRGTLLGNGSSQPIAAADLARLRAEAEAAHALGDLVHQEQHADGCVTFTLTLAGVSVSLRYETWGGCRYDRVEEIFAYLSSP